MGGGAGGFLRREDAGPVRGIGAGVQEAFPDDLHGGRGGVDEVFAVETVVPQFVQQDLVGREVGGGSRVKPGMTGGQEFLYRQVQRRLGQRVPMRPVAQVPDGGDGEKERLSGCVSTMVRSSAAQASTDSSSCANSRAGRFRQLATTGCPGRSREELLRRRPGETRVVRETADEPGSGPHFHAVLRPEGLGAVQPRDGGGEGGGIVERAERVAGHVEAGVREPCPDGVGKAAAQDADGVGSARKSGFFRSGLL